MAEVVHNESIATLIKGIIIDIRHLLREEVALARVEFREQAGRAKMAIASLGIAAVALLLGGIFLLTSVSIGIADLFDWPVWAGYLAVALVLGLIGLVLLMTGRKQMQSVRPVPQQTVATLKENSEWIAKRLSSERR